MLIDSAPQPRVDGHAHRAVHRYHLQAAPTPINERKQRSPHLVSRARPEPLLHIVRPFTKKGIPVDTRPGINCKWMDKTALHLCPKSLCDTNKRPGCTTTTTLCIFDIYQIDTRTAPSHAPPPPRVPGPQCRNFLLRNEPPSFVQY